MDKPFTGKTGSDADPAGGEFKKEDFRGELYQSGKVHRMVQVGLEKGASQRAGAS